MSFQLIVGKDLPLIFELPADGLSILIWDLQELTGLPDGQSKVYLGNEQLNTSLLLDVNVFATLTFVFLDVFLAIPADGASR